MKATCVAVLTLLAAWLSAIPGWVADKPSPGMPRLIWEDAETRYARVAAVAAAPGQMGDFASGRARVKLTLVVFGEVGGSTGHVWVSEHNEVIACRFTGWSMRGSRGQTIGALAAARLDELLAVLPAEPPMPPVERRVIVAAAGGEGWRTRVYDRANLPDALFEVFRLVGRRIEPWIRRIEPRLQVPAHGYHDGGLALAPDGEAVVSASWYDELKVWDVATASLRTTVPAAAKLATRVLCFSPNGRYLIAAESFKLLVLDTTNWRPVTTLTTEFWVDRHALTFTPDGRTLLAAGKDGIVAFDVRTWQRLQALPGLPEGTLRYTPSPDGQIAVLGTKERSVLLWDARAGRPRATLDSGCAVAFAAFSPDGQRVAVATEHPPGGDHVLTTTRLRIWDTKSARILQELAPYGRENSERMEGLLWEPRGGFLLGVGPEIGGSPRDVHVWSTTTGQHRADFVGPRTFTTGLGLTPDGKTLVVGCRDGNVCFWDAGKALSEIVAFEGSLASPSATTSPR